MRKIVFSVLWSKREIPQWILAAAGFTVGLVILFGAVRFYGDVHRVLYPADTEAEIRYIVINKKVGLGHTLGLRKTVFSPAEMQTLREQSFIKDLAPIVTTNFKIFGSFYLGMDRGLQSELFCEAVPNRFLDVQPADWAWQVGQTEIPVLISRDFLALYNFGFAAAQGLPQLTEGAIGLLPVQIVCSANGRDIPFSARIVGFTDRFSTILVPMDFMTWANEHIGQKEAPPIARVVLGIDPSQDTNAVEYLQQKSYETNREKLPLSRVAGVLNLALVLISGFGMLLLLISILSMVLILQLLIGRAREEILLLHQLGYADGTLGRCYLRVLLPMIVIPFILAGIAVFLAGFGLKNLLAQAGFTISPYPPVWGYPLFISSFLALVILLYLLIVRMIRRIG